MRNELPSTRGQIDPGLDWRRGRDSTTEGQGRGCSEGDQREPTLGPRERSPVFKTGVLAPWFARLDRSQPDFVVSETDARPPPGSSSGQLSEAQIEWLGETLAQHPNSRWTFLFLHRPLWIDNVSEWQAVEDLLEDRPRTVFAGHHHVYKVSTIGGFSYYSLATTGGVSSLAGPAEGEFDHLVWVTMMDEGPRVAILMQDGVWGDNPVAEAVGELELTTLIRQRGVTAALSEYGRVRQQETERVLFHDAPMRELGWDLMSQGKLEEAVQVLALNAETYASSSAAHSMLAEAYSRVGSREKALDSCRRALELNPTNAQATELLKEISPAASLTEDSADDS